MIFNNNYGHFIFNTKKNETCPSSFINLMRIPSVKCCLSNAIFQTEASDKAIASPQTTNKTTLKLVMLQKTIKTELDSKTIIVGIVIRIVILIHLKCLSNKRENTQKILFKNFKLF